MKIDGTENDYLFYKTWLSREKLDWLLTARKVLNKWEKKANEPKYTNYTYLYVVKDRIDGLDNTTLMCTDGHRIHVIRGVSQIMGYELPVGKYLILSNTKDCLKLRWLDADLLPVGGEMGWLKCVTPKNICVHRGQWNICPYPSETNFSKPVLDFLYALPYKAYFNIKHLADMCMDSAKWVFWIDMENQSNAVIFQHKECIELVAAMMPLNGEKHA